MKKENRAIVVVLDSLGVGELPDAAQFGDAGCHTLLHILARMPDLALPNLRSLGLLRLLGAQDAVLPQAGWGKMAERSRGKDTTTGHWELSGLVLDKPFPTFPHGFPDAFLERFSQAVGRPCIGNCTASGTEIIQRLGDEAVRRGALIVYTSADSVFQVAAHEEVVPLVGALRDLPNRAWDAHRGPGRRPRHRAALRGRPGASYVRTANRRDFSLEPAGRTMLDALQAAGRDVLAVGKISDIFAGRGITESFPTHGNEEGERALLDLLERDFSGLLFVNLVDFDMLYGHRRDAEGYGRALEHFDRTLGEALRRLRPGDLLAVTGDHGCDPTFRGTDHTREYVPLLLHGGATGDLGVRTSFSDLAATVCRHLGVAWASGEAIE